MVFAIEPILRLVYSAFSSYLLQSLTSSLEKSSVKLLKSKPGLALRASALFYVGAIKQLVETLVLIIFGLFMAWLLTSPPTCFLQRFYYGSDPVKLFFNVIYSSLVF